MFKVFLVNYDNKVDDFFTYKIIYFIQKKYKNEKKLTDIFEYIKNYDLKRNINSLTEILKPDQIEVLKKLFPKNYKYYLDLRKDSLEHLCISEYRDSLSYQTNDKIGGELHEEELDYEKELEKLFKSKRGKYINMLYTGSFKQKIKKEDSKKASQNVDIITYIFQDVYLEYPAIHFQYLLNDFVNWREILFITTNNYAHNIKFVDDIDIKRPQFLNISIFDLISNDVNVDFRTKYIPALNFLNYDHLEVKVFPLFNFKQLQLRNIDDMIDKLYPMHKYSDSLISNFEKFPKIFKLPLGNIPELPMHKNVVITKGLFLNQTFNFNNVNVIDVITVAKTYRLPKQGIIIAAKFIDKNVWKIRYRKGFETFLEDIKLVRGTRSYVLYFILFQGVLCRFYLFKNGLVKLWVIGEVDINKLIQESNQIIDDINALNEKYNFNKRSIKITHLTADNLHLMNCRVEYSNVQFDFKMKTFFKQLWPHLLYNKKKTDMTTNKINSFTFNYIQTQKNDLEKYLTYTKIAKNSNISDNINGTEFEFRDNRGNLSVYLSNFINSKQDMEKLIDLLDRLIVLYNDNSHTMHSSKIDLSNVKKIVKLQNLDPVRFRNEEIHAIKYSFLCQGDQKQPKILTQDEYEDVKDKSKYTKIKNETYSNTFNYYFCDGEKYKYLGFINRDKNPHKVCMPCCFKKKLNFNSNNKKVKVYNACMNNDEIVEKKVINTKYIYKFGKELEEGERSEAPEFINRIFKLQLMLRNDKIAPNTFVLYIDDNFNISSINNYSINTILRILTKNKPNISISLFNYLLMHKDKTNFDYNNVIYKVLIEKLSIFQELSKKIKYNTFLFKTIKITNYIIINNIYYAYNDKDKVIYPIRREEVVDLKETKQNIKLNYIDKIPKEIEPKINFVYSYNDSIIGINFSKNYLMPTKKIKLKHGYRVINCDVDDIFKLLSMHNMPNSKLKINNEILDYETHINDVKLKLIMYLKTERNAKLRSMIKSDFSNFRELFLGKYIDYDDFIELFNYYQFYKDKFKQQFNKIQFDFDKLFAKQILMHRNDYGKFEEILHSYFKKINVKDKTIIDAIVVDLYLNEFNLFEIINTNFMPITPSIELAEWEELI